jgi:protein-tyrosine phosphatase
MFSFLKSSKNATNQPILAQIEADWHCHLLPGIDDGAKNEAETLAMLQEYDQLGVKKIVVTPHVRADFYKNTSSIIRQKAEQVAQLAKAHHLPIEIEAAAEYFADEHFLHLIETNDLLPIEAQYVLFELPMTHPTLLARKLIESLHHKNLVPVLAHPERYRYWHGKLREVEKWKDYGIYFQLNLLSLTGYYGPAEQKAAQAMLDADLIDAVGTDAHSLKHLQKLASLATNTYFKALEQLPLLNRI